MTTADNETPIFTSLGMFIIDDNEYPVSWQRQAEKDILGGGGSYSIVGARIASGGDGYGKLISGIIDKGYDFPNEVQHELDSWGTGIKFRYDSTRLTTRGCNRYDENDIRHFKYLTPKVRLEVTDLKDQGLLNSKCFHLICSFDRARELIYGIRQYNPAAKFIYEPLPDDCIGENYEKMVELLPDVDVFTPNLNEACQLLKIKEPKDLDSMKSITTKYIELGAKTFVLRCGPIGCIIGTSTMVEHLPAYHNDQTNVKDVTGGGNSFCGGFMVSYYLTNDPIIGGIFGNLVSGCVIERLGPPVREDGELWNGKTIKDRLLLYLKMYNNSRIIDKIHWL